MADRQISDTSSIEEEFILPDHLNSPQPQLLPIYTEEVSGLLRGLKLGVNSNSGQLPCTS